MSAVETVALSKRLLVKCFIETDSLFFVRQKKGDGREGVTKKWANCDQVLFITYPLVKEEVCLVKTGSGEPLVG